ncbi:MAG: phage holin family protein [Candidatus Aquirickettsiella sp.]
MKIYRIKKSLAAILDGLDGLQMTRSESCYYMNVHVLDNQIRSNLNSYYRRTSLPKSCDNELVHVLFEQIQFDERTPEQVEILKEYLQLAKKKDKNNEIKSDLKKAIKQIILGLLMIAGIAGGFGLVFFLMSLSPVNAGWVALLIIPTLGIASWGLIKLVVGCFNLGLGFFSLCFRQKNIGRLPLLENQLHHVCCQPALPPPSYSEVMRNSKAIPSAPLEPPTYQQDSALLRCPTLPGFFLHHPPHRAASENAVHDNRLFVFFK